MARYYYISLECRNVGLLLGLNDAPLLRDPNGEGLVTVRAVNEWIMPAGNRFTAHLFWPGAKPYAPGQARVRAKLFIPDPASEFPKPGETLVELNWPSSERLEAYPFDFAQPFDVADPPPARVWSEAEPVTQLRASDREAIADVIRRLRERLLAGDIPGAFDLTRYRYGDEALSGGFDVDQLGGIVREQYAMLSRVPGVRIDPVEPDQLIFSTVADDRLVLVRRNGEEALVAESDEARFRFEMYFAKVNGQWVIAR